MKQLLSKYKSFACQVKDMNKSCISQVHIICKSGASYAQVMIKSLESHMQFFCDSCASYTKVNDLLCKSLSWNAIIVCQLFLPSWNWKDFQSCFLLRLKVFSVLFEFIFQGQPVLQQVHNSNFFLSRLLKCTIWNNKKKLTTVLCIM